MKAVSEQQLRIGLPKGSLQEATIAMFTKAGFSISVDERQYKPDFDDEELWGVLLRAQEIPTYVAKGILDCGLTGLDWIRECGVEDKGKQEPNKVNKVVEVCELIYAKKGMRRYKWVLAVHEDSDIQCREDLAGKRIATELVEVTKEYLAGKRIATELVEETKQYLPEPEHVVRADVIFSWGATEAKCPNLVDAIVEGTETGATLAANNLREVDLVLESTTKLIANPQAWEDSWKRQKIENIALLLQGVLDAELKVGLKMNVAREDLEAVLAVLPALKRPTVSPLANGDWVAVETIVDTDEVRILIPQLKAAGAQGIIEYPLNKVIM